LALNLHQRNSIQHSAYRDRRVQIYRPTRVKNDGTREVCCSRLI
jgi:hypothetical protein